MTLSGFYGVVHILELPGAMGRDNFYEESEIVERGIVLRTLSLDLSRAPMTDVTGKTATRGRMDSVTNSSDREDSGELPKTCGNRDSRRQHCLTEAVS